MKGSDGSISTLNQIRQRGQHMRTLGHSPGFAPTDGTGSRALTSRLLGASWRRRSSACRRPTTAHNSLVRQVGGGLEVEALPRPRHRKNKTRASPCRASKPPVSACAGRPRPPRRWQESLAQGMDGLSGPVTQWGSLTTACPALLTPGCLGTGRG